MSESSIGNQIYDLCVEFYKLEKLYEKGLSEATYVSYLIESKSIEKIKKQIDYEKMKTYLDKDINISREKFKQKIKKFSKIDTQLVPDKFKKSKDLLDALKKKKFYCIAKYKLAQKLCENTDLSNFGIKVILHKDKIRLIFNEKDELSFFNNTAGLIEISALNNNNSISGTLVKQPINNYDNYGFNQ